MVPDVAKAGTSFKGAFAYYLHDKRGPGRDGTTAERVAWTETRNLASDDLAFAQSVMIATARQADSLKEAAGVKSTGRKSNAHVYAFALAWHPDEAAGLNRDEMRRAADAALKELAADHLQAVIVCHQDTGHPHVHVIVNRVDPATGKLHTTSNDYKKLSTWARGYEQERGMIFTPGRAKEKAPKQERPAAAPAAVQAFEKVAEAKQPPAPATPADVPKPRMTPGKSRAALLAEVGAAQKIRHKLEWAQLAAANKQRRAAVYAERIDFKAIAAQHRKDVKPVWSRLGKHQADERRAFHDREKRLSGIVRNAIDVVRGQQIRGVGDDRGFLAMCFAYTVNSQARAAAFADRQRETKERMAAKLDSVLKGNFAEAKAGQAAKLDAVARTYTAERAVLIARQDLEKHQIRAEWKKVYAEREKAAQLARHADKSRDRVTRQNGENYRHGRRLDRMARPAPIAELPPAPGPAKPRVSIASDFRDIPGHPQQQPEPRPVNKDFDKATSLAPANQSKAPEQRVSVARPAPAPSPAGTPPMPARHVQNVPKVDQAQAWARTAEGQRVAAAQAQKAAPDSLRAVAPAAYRAPAKEERTTQAGSAGPPAPRQDYWAVAKPPAQEPQRADYWKENAREVAREKTTPVQDRSKDREFDRER